MSDAVWSGARAADGSKTLKPTFWGLGRLLLLLGIVAGCGIVMALLPQDSRHPTQHFKAIISAVVAGGSAAWLLARAAMGLFDLSLGPDGFTYGKTYYSWLMMTGEFAAGTGRRKNTVRFNAGGKIVSFTNFYGTPTPALVAMLNSYLPRHALPAAEPLDSAPAGPKNLPAWAWVPIITVFLLVMMNIRLIANVGSILIDPNNYAARHFDDQALADKAGRYANMLPALLQRAESGDRSAMYFYGDLFDPGDFICETTVQKNPATAIYWYQRAVALDDQGAERNLAVMYHTGDGVLRDDAIAARLFERAVAHNDDFGDYYLGQMLETGDGEPQDLPRAVQLEEAAAAQGQALGQFELGRMYFYGIGVNVDQAEAAAEWRLAAAQGNREAQGLLRANGMQ